jgi:hypothetical protein
VFKSKIIIISIFLVVIGAFMAWQLILLNPTDVQNYHSALAKIDAATLDQQTRLYKAKQERRGVSKYVSYVKDANRLYIKLESASSDIVLDHHDDITEIIEKLSDLHCVMQEELYYVLDDGRELIKKPNGQFLFRNANPSDTASWIADIDGYHLTPFQIIRTVEAKTASYYYKTDRVVANDVILSRFIFPGHQMNNILKSSNGPNSQFVAAGGITLVTGDAESVEFSLGGDDVTFTAHRLKAKFYSAKGESL